MRKRDWTSLRVLSVTFDSARSNIAMQLVLCIAQEEIDDFADLLAACGLTYLEISPHGDLVCTYEEDRILEVGRGLELLAGRLKTMPDSQKLRFLAEVAERLVDVPIESFEERKKRWLKLGAKPDDKDTVKK